MSTLLYNHLKLLLSCCFLIIGASSFKNAPLLLAEQRLEIKKANDRHLVFLKDYEESIDLCGLITGQLYQVQISPAYEMEKCYPVFYHTPTAQPNKSERYFSFYATESCASIIVTNSCNTAMEKVPAYISVSRDPSSAGPKPIDNPEAPAISTNSNVSINSMITNTFIGGNCYEISNITSAGNNNAFGTFSNGMTSIGLDQGIIISSGNIANATGPNNQTGETTDFFIFANEPDLASIAAGGIRDRAVIEFDFTPSADMVQFDYVFASEEYCDYTNTTFNDVFGFFISGPGINGPYTGNAENIALIPMTTTAVSINNVNHIDNPAYYVSNIPAGDPQLGDPDCAGHPTAGPPSIDDCQFDGYTTVLTAMANVTPCQTYHIKLAIADVTDGLFDSAVFLSANSFDSGATANVEGFGTDGSSNIIYESCGDGFFLFTRDDDDLSQPLTITYTISPNSTATPGVDYAPIPLTVTIPAGQMSVQIPIDVFEDFVIEGTESIIIELDVPCQCSNKEIEILIEDTPPLELGVNDPQVCENQSVNLDAGPSGGLAPYTYQWSTGATSQSISVTPTMDTEYYVTVTDDCGNMEVDTAMITVLPQPTATLSGLDILCEQGSSDPAELTVNFTGTGPWELIYAIDGVEQPPIITSDNPYTLSVDEIGNVTLVSVESTGAGCPGMVSGQGQVNETIINPDATPTDVLCNGDANGSISITATGGTAPYSFNWDGGLGNTQNPSNLGPGTYTVTVVDDNGCEEVTSVTINEPPQLNTNVDNTVDVDCNNATGSIDISVNGGTSPYNFQWDNGAGTGQNPSNLPPGTYNVTITDANGCTITNTATINEDLVDPTAVAAPPGIITCAEPTIVIDGTGSSTGSNFTYQWTTSGGSIVSGGTTLMPEVDGPGSYTLVVTNTDNGCTEEVTVNVTENTTPPVAVGTAPVLTCAVTEVVINGTGSSAGSNFTYQWTTSNGNIVSGSTSLMPTVNQPGTYELTVTDATNGCETIAQVTVNEDVTPPTALATAGNITCVDLTVMIDGTGSSAGSNITYQWNTNDGNIVSGSTTTNPIVDQPGTYTITVTDNNNGCLSTASVNVGLDNTPPAADAGPDMQLDCANSSVQLDGSGSAAGSNINYNWSTSDGNIVSGSTSANPTVNEPGTYTLLVTNSTNGCTSTTDVEVTEDLALPTAVILPPDVITCFAPDALLDGSFSSSGPNFTYQWSTTTGNIISGTTGAMALVDQPGTYTLTVTNTNNSCFVSESMVVIANTIAPIANAGPPQTLNCVVSEVLLNGFNSSAGGIYTYQWSTNDGNIVSGETTMAPLVNEAGTYTLTVFNSDNGCESTSQVIVDLDENVPIADAGGDLELTCLNPLVNINGTGSSSGIGITYQWSTMDGNIVAGGTGLTPLVSSPGTYNLTVVNSTNGCLSFSSVEVTDNIIQPEVDILPPGIVDCFQPTAILDGTGSSSGSNFSYFWSTTNGNIVDGQNTPIATVDAGGTYQLSIFDSSNGCSTNESIIVQEEIENPDLALAPAETITCALTEVSLDATGSSVGPNFSYSWTTTDGQIINGANTLQPEVGSGGTYTFTVFNSDNNCASTGDVFVPADNLPPGLSSGATDTLNCTILELDIPASVTGATNIDFTWSTQDGNFVTGTNTLSPTVDQPGTYELTVTNLDNSCFDAIQIPVMQDIDLPIADAGAPGIVNCYFPNIELDGSNSEAGSNFTYQWTTTDGNILSGANTTNPSIDAPGTYVITVFNQENTCFSEAVVSVDADFDLPLAEAGSPQVLGCLSPTLFLDGSNSSSGMDYVYNWTTQDGNILNGQQGTNPEVDAPGDYELTVIDTTNGCQSIDLVNIILDLEEPIVDAGPGSELTCTMTSYQLQGTADGNIDRFIYQWQTPDGNIVNGATTLTPMVDAAGQYELIVTDTINGCTETALVTVTQDANVPIAQVDVLNALNCVNNEVILDGTGSTQSPTIIYEWTTGNGNILSGSGTLEPTIDLPGTYVLTITDLANDCVSTASVTVEPDTLSPDIVLTDAGILNCFNPVSQVTATVNTNGNNFDFSWSTSDGNFNGPTDVLAPNVDEPGTYEILVTNLDNGCVSIETINVADDFVEPLANIDMPPILTCILEDLNLQAQVNTQGDNYDFTWSTPNGNILAGAFTLSPLVNEPGDYELFVQNMENGCITETSIAVLQDIIHPDAEAGPGTVLNCQETSYLLDGTLSSSNGNFSYQWTSPDGNIVNGSTSLEPTINEPGTYFLVVTDGGNGCNTLDSVTIDQDIVAPDIAPETPDILTCSELEVGLGLTLTAPDPSIFTYEWTTGNGNIITGDDTQNPIVNEPGAYDVLVTNTENFCTSTLQIPVSQNVDYPNIEAGSADLLTCAVTFFNLDGTASQIDSAFQYNWSTDEGSILSGGTTLEPVINAPGWYELSILNPFNNCESIDSVFVDIDVVAPDAEAGGTNLLTCTVQELSLDGTGSSQGIIYTYQWTTGDGNIISGATSTTPMIDEPGTYTIEVLNTFNGCTSIDEVTITQDVDLPVVAIANPAILNCILDDQLLNGSGSSQGTEFSYTWSTPDGQIISGANAINSTIGEPGTYTLTVLNTLTGCENSTTTEVEQNIIDPTVDISAADTLTCTFTTVDLAATASGNSTDLSYQWTTSNGAIVAGATSLFPTVNSSGTYTLTVIDQDNGCETSQSIFVPENTVYPIVSILEPAILNCVTDEVVISANGSSSGSTFNLEWTTNNGNFVSGQSTLSPIVDLVGNYQLQITDLVNGCVTTGNIAVDGDYEAPDVDAGDDFVLPCFEDFASLEGIATAGGQPVSILWTTNNGNIIGGEQSFTPAVDQGGTYTMLIQNLTNGCTAQDFVVVTEDRPLEPPVDPAFPACFGDFGSIQVGVVNGGTPPYLYSIDGGENYQSGPSFAAVDPGSYEVIVQDVNGCETPGISVFIPQPIEVMVEVEEPRVELLLGETYQVDVQVNLLPQNISSVQWNPGDGFSCTDCLDPLVTPLQTNVHEVIVTSDLGCEDRTIIEFVVDRRPAVYIPNAFSPNGDGNNEVFMIFAKDESVSKINRFLVFSRWGETVFEYYDFQPNNPAYGWDGYFRGEPMNPAVFAWFAEIEFIDGRTELFEGDVTLVR